MSPGVTGLRAIMSVHVQLSNAILFDLPVVYTGCKHKKGTASTAHFLCAPNSPDDKSAHYAYHLWHHWAGRRDVCSLSARTVFRNSQSANTDRCPDKRSCGKPASPSTRGSVFIRCSYKCTSSMVLEASDWFMMVGIGKRRTRSTSDSVGESQTRRWSREAFLVHFDEQAIKR